MKITEYKHFISTDDDSEFVKTGRVGVYSAAVGGIIMNEQNEILLTRRSLDNLKSPGVWEILFGRVDQGESFEEALIREGHEELGIEVVPEKLLSTMHFTRLPSEPEHIGVIYICSMIDGQEIKPDPKEIADWQWMDIDEAINKVVDYVKPHLEWVRERGNTFDI